MHLANRCSVAILRPVQTEGIDFLMGDRSTMPPEERIRSQRLDELVDETISLVGDAADSAKILTDTTEYQLHAREGRPHVMSRKRSASVRDHDLVISLDPTESELGFLCKIIDTHELQRALIFFTSSETRESLFMLLGTKRVPVLQVSEGGSVKFKKLPKLFSGHLPLNEDKAADAHKENVATTELALRFPNIPLQEATREQFMGICVARSY